MRRVQKHFTMPSKVVNSEAYNTDINAMIAGKVPFTQARRSFYIDETALPDTYEEAYNLVLQAQDAFMQLPPQIREKFANDPANLSKALSDPSQHDALRDLGILPPVTAPEVKRPQKAGETEGAPPSGGSDDAGS